MTRLRMRRLGDAAWANERLRQLRDERRQLESRGAGSGQPPQIDAKEAMCYRRQTRKVLSRGSAAERKKVLRTWVRTIKLAPEDLEVEIEYQIPEPVMNRVVAGAGFEPATFRL